MQTVLKTLTAWTKVGRNLMFLPCKLLPQVLLHCQYLSCNRLMNLQRQQPLPNLYRFLILLASFCYKRCLTSQMTVMILNPSRLVLILHRPKSLLAQNHKVNKLFQHSYYLIQAHHIPCLLQMNKMVPIKDTYQCLNLRQQIQNQDY